MHPPEEGCMIHGKQHGTPQARVVRYRPSRLPESHSSAPTVWHSDLCKALTVMAVVPDFHRLSQTPNSRLTVDGVRFRAIYTAIGDIFYAVVTV